MCQIRRWWFHKFLLWHDRLHVTRTLCPNQSLLNVFNDLWEKQYLISAVYSFFSWNDKQKQKLELNGPNLWLLVGVKDEEEPWCWTLASAVSQYASLCSSLSDLILLSAVYLLSSSCLSWQFNSEVKPAGLLTTLTVVSFLQRDGEHLHFLKIKAQRLPVKWLLIFNNHLNV